MTYNQHGTIPVSVSNITINYTSAQLGNVNVVTTNVDCIKTRHN